MPLQTDTIDPLLLSICDPSAVATSGTAGVLLRDYAQLPHATSYFSNSHWWREATVQATIYARLQALGVAQNFLLSEQPYDFPDVERSDIMVVDSSTDEVLGIEIKADFNQGSTTNDIDKLATLIDQEAIDYGVAIFVVDQERFDQWLIDLRLYSDNTTGGSVEVGGIYTVPIQGATGATGAAGPAGVSSLPPADGAGPTGPGGP